MIQASSCCMSSVATACPTTGRPASPGRVCVCGGGRIGHAGNCGKNNTLQTVLYLHDLQWSLQTHLDDTGKEMLKQCAAHPVITACVLQQCQGDAPRPWLISARSAQQCKQQKQQVLALSELCGACTCA
jgi:hypothetical protein